MRNDAEQYPEYRRLYVNAFQRMIDERTKAGLDTKRWNTCEDVFRWWVGLDPDQITFEDYLSTDEVG